MSDTREVAKPTERDEAAPPVAPLDWTGLRPMRSSEPDAVTIVVPVYGALQETLACLHSVLSARTEVAVHLVAIDDRSPDAGLLDALMDASHQERLFSVWRNDGNKGFVHTANRGLLAARGDVVLLNSDTIVTDGWLDRMVAVARGDPTIASVSPMTNNATILSYPAMNVENRLPRDVTLADIAGYFATNRPGLVPVQVPVTVGFCMLLTQAAIEDVGALDEGLFGIGYGEESDWCMRAAASGYTHAVAIDAYVHHLGSRSFSDKAVRRQVLAEKALAMRYPHYWPAIGAFCAADPLRAARRQVDGLRLRKAAARFEGLVVHVLHALGGGTQVHAHHLADLLAAQGYGSIFLKPDSIGKLVVTAHFLDEVPNLVFDCTSDLTALRALFDHLKVERRHIHAIIGFSREAIAFIDSIEAPTTITLHDYVPLCPQITLLDDTGRYCGVPAQTRCNQCLSREPSPLAVTSIHPWRQAWGARLSAADRLVTPSEFARARFARVFPDLAIEVVVHHEAPIVPISPSAGATTTPRSSIRHVAVLGSLNRHKGIDVLAACAQDAFDRDLPICFHLFGAAAIEEDGFGGKLRKTGKYMRDDLPMLLAESGCGIGFLPSIWPETYSFVLSEMWALGLHPVAFDLGAQADRIRAAGSGAGTLLPIGLTGCDINARLLAIETAARIPAIPYTNSPEGSVSDYLERLYGRLPERQTAPLVQPSGTNASSTA